MIQRLIAALAAVLPLLASGTPLQAREAPRATSCLLTPSLKVELGTAEEGTLTAVNADRGDQVDKGQRLARLNDGVQLAAVERAKANVAFARRELERNEDLHLKKFVSRQELDQLETELELAEMDLRQAREELRLRHIVNPVDGVVLDRMHARGDLVHQEVVFRIAQLDPLYVEAVVPAKHFGRVERRRYSVRVPMLDVSAGAEVVAIDPVIDPASGTFRVRLTLPNPDHAIPAGARCRLVFREDDTE